MIEREARRWHPRLGARSIPAADTESESGAGSIVVVAIVAAMVLLVSLVLTLGFVLNTQQRAAGAADAAALAGADVAAGIRAGSPCDAAGVAAVANDTAMTACVVDGAVVTVRVIARAAGFTIGASASAGPPP